MDSIKKSRRIRISPGRLFFEIINYSLLGLTAILCIIPVVHVFAVSLSSAGPAAAGRVGLWPIGVNLQAYEYVMSKPEFGRSLWITFQRTVIGTSISIVLTILTAYPLSKDKTQFKARSIFVWVFYFTALFGGGLIPTYLVVNQTGIIDSIWALTIPDAVAIANIVLMLNFFRRLPKEIEEAALIDGAGQWRILLNIVVPVSKAVIATVVLFQMVYHWNEWFYGRIYMNKTINYPLQAYLRGLIAPDAVGLEMMTMDEALAYINVNTQNSKAAQIFVAAIPIIITYPFLQKYFATGIVLGSVKG